MCEIRVTVYTFSTIFENEVASIERYRYLDLQANFDVHLFLHVRTNEIFLMLLMCFREF